ncbi:hypothetical protein TVAG_170380 [Trichomonas vaginalis G3]|uniref:Arrestin-like N-terminal domain-containing protein n=1 Tax=Trichomonas vaginalis (strain ATCC PRA-98 / G3) TaxID=412133 RepID=A2DPI0_TRIV3|nr:hypothetical protein TVAGG3_0680480 [Trichomonas vaginalis G3]EAY17724.1 hypothetical protein TVAG_170380 [Trichomonas vaginalis G3]KAI5507872.1 hypothetical protein TVAGG3_0680480 [Trichomonas vaginalis G3]|eukprot:XP_001329859.1 hypothetical protein [Trichomonas vaginalis G3]
MRVSILPECPSIFLGQEFMVQISIAEAPTQIKWISAQITGKVQTLKPSVEPALLSLVHRALGAPQQAPFFGHVMSGSRLIDSDIKTPKTYCLSIKADGIPPSYDGEAVSISYELRIVSQIGQQISQPTIIPIKFISPYKSNCILQNTQNTATFTLTSIESASIPSPIALLSPFPPVQEKSLDIFSIKQGDSIVASLKLKLSARSGGDFSGIIDMKESTSGVTSVNIRIIRVEKFSNDVTDQTIIVNENLPLDKIIMRRFSLPMPFNTPAEFVTDLFECSYSAEFNFIGPAGAWKWVAPLQVLPPLLSLSMPRQAIEQISL